MFEATLPRGAIFNSSAAGAIDVQRYRSNEFEPASMQILYS